MEAGRSVQLQQGHVVTVWMGRLVLEIRVDFLFDHREGLWSILLATVILDIKHAQLDADVRKRYPIAEKGTLKLRVRSRYSVPIGLLPTFSLLKSRDMTYEIKIKKRSIEILKVMSSLIKKDTCVYI